MLRRAIGSSGLWSILLSSKSELCAYTQFKMHQSFRRTFIDKWWKSKCLPVITGIKTGGPINVMFYQDMREEVQKIGIRRQGYDNWSLKRTTDKQYCDSWWNRYEMDGGEDYYAAQFKYLCKDHVLPEELKLVLHEIMMMFKIVNQLRYQL